MCFVNKGQSLRTQLIGQCEKRTHIVIGTSFTLLYKLLSLTLFELKVLNVCH